MSTEYKPTTHAESHFISIVEDTISDFGFDSVVDVLGESFKGGKLKYRGKWYDLVGYASATSNYPTPTFLITGYVNGWLFTKHVSDRESINRHHVSRAVKTGRILVWRVWLNQVEDMKMSEQGVDVEYEIF